MDITHQTLQPNRFYHIYNRGNNKENLFREEGNYEYFLKLYEKYIHPVCETYAWVLMKNHFHLLVRFRGVKDLTGTENLTGLPGTRRKNLSGLGSEEEIPYYYSKQFSNLFNAYTKAFNKKYGRVGSLFQRPFRRIEVENNDHLKRLVVYINNNPVKHGFAESAADYPWSSYHPVVSGKPTKVKKDELIKGFGDLENFMWLHKDARYEPKEDLMLE